MKNKNQLTMTFIRSLIVSIILTLIFSFNFTLPGVIREIVTDESLVATYKDKGLFYIEGDKFGRLFAFPCLGAGLGCLLTQFLKINLKSFLFLGNIFFTFGTLLQFLMFNYWIFLIARIVIGVGIGIVCSIVPTYLSIISPMEKRGFYCSLQQIALVSGFFFSTVCRYYFNNERWKIPFYATFFLSASLYGILPFVENPIISKNKGKSIIDLFKTKEAYLSIITGLLMHLSQHLASINVIICYTDEIFEHKKMYHIIFNIVQILFTCINGFFIERFGRKQLLLLSIFVTFFSLCFLSFGKLEKAFAFLYIAGFCIGLGPVIWYASAEIFPPEFVVTGISLLSLTNWFWGWFQQKVCFYLKNKMGNMAYMPFNVGLGLCLIYFMVFFKETKNKPADFQ